MIDRFDKWATQHPLTAIGIGWVSLLIAGFALLGISSLLVRVIW